MATAIEEDKRAKRTGPAGFTPGLDVAAPLNLTPPGTMRPDAPTPVATQPAPQFDRTNAGPMLRPPPAATAPVAAPNLEQQRLANQTSMYVQGAQATAAGRPVPTPTAATAPAEAQPTQPQGEYGRQMSNVGGFFADAISGALKTAVSAPGYGMNKGSPTAPSTPAASPGENYGNEGRRTPVPAGAPTATQTAAPTAPLAAPANPQAAPTAPQSTEMAGPPSGYTSTSVDGVYRKGNSFMDEAGTRGAPRAGMVSPQNEAAATALGANQQALTRLQAGNAPAAGFQPNIQMPSVKTSANDWQARNDLRSLRVSANSLSNDPRWGGMGMKSPDVMAYQAAIETDNALKQGKNPLAQEMLQQQGNLARTQVQDQGATQRAGMQEQGANTRAGMTNEVQQGELGLRREAQGFTSRAAQRLEQAQQEYLAAKTPEEQAKAAKRIREIQGKEKPETWKGVALQGGTDAQGNKTESVLAAVNEATGEMRKFKGAVTAAPMPASKDKLESGKVYETSKGPATWDGKNFIPVQ